MTTIANPIRELQVAPGTLAIFWLAQAGFVFKNSAGGIVYVDPYLSDVVEEQFGFKRMMACPIRAEEVSAHLVVCTHEHLDHMDTGALPVIARNTAARFAGPVECVKYFREMGLGEERCLLLEEGKQIDVDGVRVAGVYADHGTLAPDALGVVLDFDGVRVYHTGDTAYRPECFHVAAAMRPDVLLPCINGRYGNMDSREAALLVRDLSPRLAIASHFWMFVEHGGDPAAFLESCARLAPEAKAIVMKPGECCVVAGAKS
jgi:L-ascorbate 6-phosphate lactonase